MSKIHYNQLQSVDKKLLKDVPQSFKKGKYTADQLQGLRFLRLFKPEFVFNSAFEDDLSN